MAADAGKIPTWALVMGTGIGLVFYAQREFVPRTEQDLGAKAHAAQIEALGKRDDELASSVKAVATLIEKSNQDMRAAIDAHAKQSSHLGTAEQNAAVLSYLLAQQANQRQIYSVVQAMAQKQHIPAPPLTEIPLPQPSFPR